MKILKLIFTTVFLLTIFITESSAEKYFTRTGHINFVSETPLLTLVADNHSVVSFLDIETGEMVFGVLMRSFKFKQALAEEHFNENYAESDKFPKAKFKGKILNFEKLDLSKDAEYDVKVEGNLTIHGETNKVSAKGKLIVKDGKITAQAVIKIDVEDYGIEIPTVVADKVATIIPIKINMIYKKYKR